MFFWRKKRKQMRAEAERAVRETEELVSRVDKKEQRDKGLFAAWGQIRRDNHIAEAVRSLMGNE